MQSARKPLVDDTQRVCNAAAAAQGIVQRGRVRSLLPMFEATNCSHTAAAQDPAAHPTSAHVNTSAARACHHTHNSGITAVTPQLQTIDRDGPPAPTTSKSTGTATLSGCISLEVRQEQQQRHTYHALNASAASADFTNSSCMSDLDILPSLPNRPRHFTCPAGSTCIYQNESDTVSLCLPAPPPDSPPASAVGGDPDPLCPPRALPPGPHQLAGLETSTFMRSSSFFSSLDGSVSSSMHERAAPERPLTPHGAHLLGSRLKNITKDSHLISPRIAEHSQQVVWRNLAPIRTRRKTTLKTFAAPHMHRMHASSYLKDPGH